MQFSYKLKNIQTAKNQNYRLKSWLLSNNSSEIIFYDDEIYFRTMVLKGALVLDSVTLKKEQDYIKAKVVFNKWSLRFISLVLTFFFFLYIFNILQHRIWTSTFVVLFFGCIMYSFAYVVLKYEMRAALLGELKD